MHDLIKAAKVCRIYNDVYERAFKIAVCSDPQARLVHCSRAGQPYAYVTRSGSVVDPSDGQVYPEGYYKKHFKITDTEEYRANAALNFAETLGGYGPWTK